MPPKELGVLLAGSKQELSGKDDEPCPDTGADIRLLGVTSSLSCRRAQHKSANDDIRYTPRLDVLDATGLE